MRCDSAELRARPGRRIRAVLVLALLAAVAAAATASEPRQPAVESVTFSGNRSVPGDTLRALDQDAAVGVPPGEVAYACGNTVLTRHFVWRQAQHGSITPRTESVLFVSEVLREIPGEVVGAVREELVSGLRDFFGVESNAVLLSETNLHATW